MDWSWSTNRALAAATESQANDEEQIDPNTQSRFSKLILIDQEYAKYKQKIMEILLNYQNFAIDLEILQQVN